MKAAVLGGGLAGCCTALALSARGFRVDLYEQHPRLLNGASLHNEGKLHFGYVYAADPEARTHGLLAEGSLRFLPILERLTRTPRTLFRRSVPFTYAIPRDSMLPVGQIEQHFAAVDQAVAQWKETLDGARDDSLGPVRRIKEAALGGYFDRELIEAGFHTSEYSVDTMQVAAAVAGAVQADRAITALLDTGVVAADVAGSEFVVHYNANGTRGRRRYPLVINCLWHDRMRLDQSVGFTASPPCLMRYKAAITLQSVAAPPDLVSTTLVLGAFGDLVNHGDGKLYLSWYPACKLAESTCADPAMLLHRARLVDQARVVAESIRGMGKYVPPLARMDPQSFSISFSGGVIVAHGQTDISDPGSGLHARHRIGPQAKGRWISLDTGKYRMAPRFALETAEMATAMLA